MPKKSEPLEIEAMGFTVHIDPAVLLSMDYVDLAADVYNPEGDEGSRIVATTNLFRLVFGAEYRAVKDHFVTAEAVSSFFAEVTGQISALKN
jgi:hypothetical protein